MHSIMKYINIISRCATQYRSDMLTDTGINGCQCTYILNICKNPGISQEKLARIICINKSNVTRQLSVLEANGFIERRCNESDKRVMEVYPTDKALKLLPKVTEVMHTWRDIVTQDFSEEEKELFSKMLERAVIRAEEYMEGQCTL